MSLYKVLKPVGYFGRREIGEVIELTDDEAKSIGDEYIAPMSATEVSVDNVEDEAAEMPEETSKPKRSSKKSGK